ncbi:superoxide dismutase mitochondrial precursor [Terfezia boudieri ATCC MYA-4762]|uniref:Superoxide dismutase n=1 Tax=Terfezia boudieri ATCC MYA-4762 TaxID=1051890 RepID=A0A3N4LPS3_9PEZI|nr:superoxide dismutase mitochondrial precursor [Terfezia boudieri ATCC MYA-4762]
MSLSNLRARLLPSTVRAVRVASTQATRAKHTLPDLPYDYGALEPVISGKIMELHHKKHHQTYVNGLNDAEAKYAEALGLGDVAKQVELQALVKFHGGGHLNHTLFWENLAPKSSCGGAPPSGILASQINKTFGTYDAFKKAMNAALMGVQGSGWAWLVKDSETGGVGIVTRPNQDPVVGKLRPLLGIDAWEHAYYLQYENRKAEYFGAIWDVVNWKAAEKRFAA